MNDSAVRLVIKAKNHKLLKEREARGYSQAEMGEHCGVSQATIGQAERLEFISENAALKISNVLGYKPDELFPNWLEMYGEVFNGKNYLVLDDDFAQKQLASYGGNKLLLKESFENDLENALALLPDKEKHIIKNYFGVLGCKSQTLEELGEEMNLTPTRVRQLRNRGLRSLRRYNGEGLKEYLGEAQYIEVDQ